MTEVEPITPNEGAEISRIRSTFAHDFSRASLEAEGSDGTGKSRPTGRVDSDTVKTFLTHQNVLFEVLMVLCDLVHGQDESASLDTEVLASSCANQRNASNLKELILQLFPHMDAAQAEASDPKHTGTNPYLIDFSEKTEACQSAMGIADGIAMSAKTLTDAELPQISGASQQQSQTISSLSSIAQQYNDSAQDTQKMGGR